MVTEVIVWKAAPDTVSSVCPHLCPKCLTLCFWQFAPIVQHFLIGGTLGRLGSVNCKGMWHSFLKLRMFLWISGVDFCHFHCGVWRKCFRTDTQANTECILWTSFMIDCNRLLDADKVFIFTGDRPVNIVIVLLSTSNNIKYVWGHRTWSKKLQWVFLHQR